MPTPFKWVADFVVGNSSSGANDRNPSVMTLPSGQIHFLQANGWTTDNDAYAYIFNGNGAYASSVIGFETGSTINGDQVSGTVLPDGRRIYVWTEAPAAGGGDGRDVYMAIRYGNSVSGSIEESRVLVAGGAGDQLEPVVAASTSGASYAVAYADQSVAGGQLTVKFYDAGGAVITTVTPANTTAGVSNYGGGDYRHIGITALSNGNYVVAWYDASPEEARFQIFSSNGGAVGAEVTLTTPSSDYQPAVVALADGRFVITVYNLVGTVSGQIYNADGSVSVAPFTIGSDANQGAQQNVSTAALADGRFVTVWQTTGGEIVGQVMFADGTADGTQFAVNTGTTGIQSDPHVAAMPDGRFVVTWTDENPAIDAIMGAIFDPRGGAINMSGSSFNDDLYGTGYADALYLGAGNDQARGEGGADYLVGEAGNDTLYGGAGGDILYGGASDDVLNGDADNDFVYGGVGNDNLSGNDGSDFLNGEGTNDTLQGGAGNDTVLGGEGADLLYGDANDDSMDGGTQNDTLYAGDGADFARGWDGDDAISGQVGNDQLYGDDGNDTIDGGDGADIVYGGLGADYALGGIGGDVLIGQEGNDDLRGGDDDDSIDGGADNDILYGGGGADYILGGDGLDVLYGEASADQLRGEAGNDTIVGGAGGDTLFGGTGSDRFVFAVGSGVDSINDWTDGEDRIDISGYAGATFANTVITQSGGNVLVTFVGGDQVILLNTTLATVTIADFIT